MNTENIDLKAPPMVADLKSDGLGVRDEAVIFADLEHVCQSPGFAHVIARMCLLDNTFSYTEEASADDMMKLHSGSRLLRNEMNACIGLWAKSGIDFSGVMPAAVAETIAEVRDLCDQLHRAMNEPTMASLAALFRGGTEGADMPHSSGEAMREAIFYGAESAYPFQYREFAALRYKADEQWIVQNKGFTMSEAAAVAKAVSKIIDKRASAALARCDGDLALVTEPLDIFTFSTQELSDATKLPALTCERVIEAFTYPASDGNAQFVKVDARNMTAILPIVRRDDRFVVFNVVDFCEVLYQAPYFWMLGDKAYRPTAADHRGDFTEEFARMQLTAVFGAARTMLNVNLMRSKDVAGEIDVLVVFSKYAIVVQAKSKQLTAVARQGDEKQIRADFAAAVQEACDQGMDCAKMLLDPGVRLVNAEGVSIEHPQVEKVFVVCLVADHYPALAAQARQFLKFDPVERVAPPLVMDVFLLDALAEMLDSPLHFLSYLERRSGYADRILSNHEFGILGFHLSQNLWVEEETSLIHIQDDVGVNLELSMLARREGLRAPWTPKGILTFFVHTPLGALLKKIERQPNPGMVELGFLILAMSGDAIDQANTAIVEISRRAMIDGRPHDFTMALKGGSGLTFHSSRADEAEAREIILIHCERRKYLQRSKQWFGVVLDPADSSMRFGVMLDFEWAKDAQLEVATSGMRGVPNVSKTQWSALLRQPPPAKVGRNAQCSCGSGKKSKRCCRA